MVDCTNGSSNTRIPSLVCDPVKRSKGNSVSFSTVNAPAVAVNLGDILIN